MKKQIYKSILITASVVLLLTTTLLSFLFYGQLHNVLETDMRQQANTFIESTSDVAMQVLSTTHDPKIRVNIIAPDGTVVFDDTPDAKTFANQKDTPEFIQALSEGAGSNNRYSDTMAQKVDFYAVRLADGYVLRLANTNNGVRLVATPAIAVFIIMLILTAIGGYFVAKKTTKNIVKPINKIKVSQYEKLSELYEELAPFQRTIMHQEEKADGKVSSLKERTHTIITIMNNMSEGMIMLDQNSNILLINQSACDIFQMTEESNRNILEVVRDFDFIQNIKLALDGERIEMTFDKNDKIYRVYFSPISNVGAVVLLLDITEKQKAEMIRQEFSANVSRELQLPLIDIVNDSEQLLNDTNTSQEQAVLYEKINQESSDLLLLLQDIMYLSDLDLMNKIVQIDDVHVKELSTAIVDKLSDKAQKKNIAIHLDADDIVLKANDLHMYQLLYNVIENAVKYNRQDGTVDISIKQDADTGKTKIIVADNGTGIPLKDQERIFERFYRVEKGAATNTKGTGLGLAIVKHIVSAYGGTIDLKSDKNGTRIEIELP